VVKGVEQVPLHHARLGRSGWIGGGGHRDRHCHDDRGHGGQGASKCHDEVLC
jgi:hypothetical protein